MVCRREHRESGAGLGPDRLVWMAALGSATGAGTVCVGSNPARSARRNYLRSEPVSTARAPRMLNYSPVKRASVPFSKRELSMLRSAARRREMTVPALTKDAIALVVDETLAQPRLARPARTPRGRGVPAQALSKTSLRESLAKPSPTKSRRAPPMSTLSTIELVNGAKDSRAWGHTKRARRLSPKRPQTILFENIDIKAKLVTY